MSEENEGSVWTTSEVSEPTEVREYKNNLDFRWVGTPVKTGKRNVLDFKWCHPEGIGGNNWKMPGLSNGFFDYQQKTVEKLYKKRNKLRAQLLDMYLESESEKKKERGYWVFDKAAGCPEEPDAPLVDVVARVPSDLAEGEKVPCVFDIQGGGWYEGGTYEYFMGPIEAMCKKHHCVVVSFCYRMLYEVGGLEMVNDCHAAYQWMLDHADELHIDINKVVVHGYSAGGTLAASLGFRLKRYDIHPCGVFACMAPLDDVNNTSSGMISYWSDESNSYEAVDGDFIRMLMKPYMGNQFGDPAASPELIPSRATVEDCKGYPPLWMSIAELDSSRDSALDLARKMHEAGTFCEYHVWGAANHNTCDPNTALGKRISDEEHAWIQDAISYDFTRPWLREE
ncbi:MAG: alpha/beta hydrolase fold domain-containing protein [Coriobacteriaceae bacterium]|nr:alpha/beta hydrolase fold domain-containing protein [Coriobacteriaceae bacterium]